MIYMLTDFPSFFFQALQNANVIIGEIRETHMW